MGLGRGFRWYRMGRFFSGRWPFGSAAGSYADQFPEEEASFLEQEAKTLEGQLRAVKKRLNDLRESAEKEG